MWVTKHKLRAYECMVGMIGEKAETKEMKQRLADYLRKKILWVQSSILWKLYTKRPDVLMEASDITGDLRICMQIIATAERELATTGGSILDRSCTFEDYMHLFKTLNGIVRSTAQADRPQRIRKCLQNCTYRKKPFMFPCLHLQGKRKNSRNLNQINMDIRV